jgi:hypothetical protein
MGIKTEQLASKASGKPGVATNVCNPRCLGGKDQEDLDSRPALAKKLRPISTNKLAIVVHACLSSKLGGRIQVR